MVVAIEASPAPQELTPQSVPATAEPQWLALSLLAEEVALLERVLTCYLSDLRTEIAHTDDYDFREALKRDRSSLQAILSRLRQLRPQ